MLAKVQKWGNSLAVRLPKALAEEADVQRDTPVEICVRNHEIVLRAVVGRYCLDELLSRVTNENLHDETNTGSPLGGEVW